MEEMPNDNVIIHISDYKFFFSFKSHAFSINLFLCNFIKMYPFYIVFFLLSTGYMLNI